MRTSINPHFSSHIFRGRRRGDKIDAAHLLLKVARNQHRIFISFNHQRLSTSSLGRRSFSCHRWSSGYGGRARPSRTRCRRRPSSAGSCSMPSGSKCARWSLPSSLRTASNWHRNSWVDRRPPDAPQADHPPLRDSCQRSSTSRIARASPASARFWTGAAERAPICRIAIRYRY